VLQNKDAEIVDNLENAINFSHKKAWALISKVNIIHPV